MVSLHECYLIPAEGECLVRLRAANEFAQDTQSCLNWNAVSFGSENHVGELRGLDADKCPCLEAERIQILHQPHPLAPRKTKLKVHPQLLDTKGLTTQQEAEEGLERFVRALKELSLWAFPFA